MSDRVLIQESPLFCTSDTQNQKNNGRPCYSENKNTSLKQDQRNTRTFNINRLCCSPGKRSTKNIFLHDLSNENTYLSVSETRYGRETGENLGQICPLPPPTYPLTQTDVFPGKRRARSLGALDTRGIQRSNEYLAGESFMA